MDVPMQGRHDPHTSRRRLYYGWYVVAACHLVAWMTWGIGVFNQGVFLGFFTQKYGWSRLALSFAPTLFYIWAGLLGMIVGPLLDRYGPRPILAVGAVLLGGGALALGLTRQLWQLYPAFLLLSTGYACLHTVTLGAIIARWFVQDRARAMVVVTCGGSLGGMLLSPLNAALLEHWGGLAGGLTLAVLAVGVVVPLALWVVKDGPEVLGLEADGTHTPADTGHPLSAPADDPVWTLTQAMRTRAFWAIALSFHLAMIAQAGFLIHQVPFLQPTFGLLGAAGLVTITTLVGAVGGVSFALFGHRASPHRWATGVFALEAVGLLLSAVGSGPWVLIAGSAVFGLPMMLVVSLLPVTAAECFGQRSFGRIYGVIYTVYCFGTALGPLLLGFVASVAGSYQPALLVVVAGPLLAAGLIRWAIPPFPGMNAPTKRRVRQAFGSAGEKDLLHAGRGAGASSGGGFEDSLAVSTAGLRREPGCYL